MEDSSVPKIEILTGPPDLARDQVLFGEVCERLPRSPFSFLYLVPTRRKVRALRARILDEGGLRAFCPERIATLDDFAAQAFGRLFPDQRVITEDFSRIMVESILAARDRFRVLKGLHETCPPGLIATAARAIEQLKAHAVSPHAAASVARETGNATLVDLAEVYGEYERVLNIHSLADTQSVLLRLADAHTIVDGLEVLYVDGFSDFTPAQERFIKQIIRLADRAVFLVDCLPNRKDTFGPTEEMLSHLAPAAKRSLRRRVTASPFTDVASSVFTSQTATGTHDASGHVQFMRPSDRTTEVETIAAEIKSILLGHSPPPMHRIAVTFPNMVAYAPLVREVFPRYGLDFNLSHEFALAESPVAIATLAIVETVHYGFKRDDVLKLLGSPYVAFRFGDGRVLNESLVRRCAYLAGVIEGAQDWTEKLERLDAELQVQQDDADADLPDDRTATLAEQNAVVKQGIAALIEELARIPSQATVSAYSETLKSIMQRFGMAERLLPENPAHLPPVEIEKAFQAHVRVCSVLDELAYSERLLGRDAVSLAEFYTMLRVAVSEGAYQVRTYDDAGVQVLGLLEMRGLDFDIVFLGGLLNGEFPQWPRENVLVAGEPARRLKLRPTESKLAIQRCRFLQLLCSARWQLTLSCPATVRGEPGVSSFFFDEALRACGSPDPLSAAPDQMCSMERLQCAAGRWLAEPPSTLTHDITGFLARSASPDGPLHFMLENMNIERARRNETTCLDARPYTGVLSGPAAETVARDFGGKHLFSVRQLESYAQCPFAFFAESVLGLAQLEPPEEEMTPRTRGSLLHESLRRFYTARRHKGRTSILEDEKAEAADELKRIIIEVFGELGLNDLFRQKEIERITRAGGLAEAFVENECATSGPFEPRYFEFAFGRSSRMGEVDPAATQPPLLISKGLRVIGKVDRVDVSPEGQAVVMDYKTGSLDLTEARRGIADGCRLQLPLYLLAVRELLQLDPAAAIYYLLRDDDFGHKGLLLDETLCSTMGTKMRRNSSALKYLPEGTTLAQVLADTRSRVTNLAAFLRTGHFPPGAADTDGRTCKQCAYARICRLSADGEGP